MRASDLRRTGPGTSHYTRRGWAALAIQPLGRRAGPTVLGYIEDELAELSGGRRLAEDLPPIRVQLERAVDLMATLDAVLNKKDRELAVAYEVNPGKPEDRLSTWHSPWTPGTTNWERGS